MAPAYLPNGTLMASDIRNVTRLTTGVDIEDLDGAIGRTGGKDFPIVV
tara:strand:- start:46 stop:189 length:144 start_codon:yes stop_codon:yes gene_type:complete